MTNEKKFSNALLSKKWRNIVGRREGKKHIGRYNISETKYNLLEIEVNRKKVKFN